MTAPLLLGDNRVPVYYAGGAGIDDFRGTSGAGRPSGSSSQSVERGPEDWVGSMTALPAAILPPGHPADTGVSRTPLGSLADLVADDPVGWLGERLAATFGGHSGLLVKLLDAGERLPVHCHPSRAFAREHLECVFGKTEGWIVLATTGDAKVWLGMRHRVDRADLRRWIADQDTAAMLAAMNELTVRPGQVLYVPAGLPHAIGPGVTIVELQEPTSFSILADHTAFRVDADAATLGLGWDLALSCFDLESYAYRLDDLLPTPRPLPGVPGVANLFGPAADTYFRAWLVECAGTVTLPDAGFAVVVVTAGRGELRWAGGSLPIDRGKTLVAPSAAGALEFRGEVAAIVCRPAEV
ncbi:class I mannose-6-phosphate isomerase [Phytohabitans sp. ZYX-F-186]|uniref:Class I mannose-6-phosphate isomerase n=1 Tax=Phytohabitans maris TaxID=3071409 RepID=A0ABU0Z9N7_9ACTN|nr:class I mannose-6-phosphate isomerase [Phytohabitans sp. ZYX-F-186]MDQ7903765.1 class I mannose-6-phosphate isomerase [Phytohabitans sp. ZYX-F-186]